MAAHVPARLAGMLLCLAPWLPGAALAEHPYAGGETTRVIDELQAGDRGAFSFPATNLALTRRDRFFVGNSFFRNAWVSAPASTEARDGLGPLYNTNACQSCHIRDGRGRPPRPGEDMVSMLVRISVPGNGSKDHEITEGTLGSVPHPVYGGQVQNQGIQGVTKEAFVEIEWAQTTHRFADGSSYRLRRPRVVFTAPGYGPLGDDLRVSPRVPPPMIGLGLLDTVAGADIRALADPEDADGDGISGRASQVWDRATERRALGRFGWKASQPTIRQQVASAFAGDLGITSSLFPDQPCTPTQRECLEQPAGGEPEVSDEILDFVTFYAKTLAVPARRSHDNPFILEGEALFEAAGCNACHVETLATAEDPDFPELSGQEIHPYTDLLLHDMGPGLADGHAVFNAAGSEWRTPPLWGIGLTKLVNEHTNFLHDGRARSIEEAILWHGGEAEAAKAFFVGLSAEERRKLVAFVKSL